MRKRIFIALPMVTIGFMVGALSAINVTAQALPTATNAANSTETGMASNATPIQLSSGVPDVLKLAQSKIGDDTLIAFINNSSKTYNLSASEIIYLREQGVSDRVMTAMLSQPGKTAGTAAPATTTWSAPAKSEALVATAPSTTYVGASPTYLQPSTVYVAAPAPAYSYVYPSYGYYYPPVSLSLGFGFGSYYGYGGYHGYHGGSHGYGGHH